MNDDVDDERVWTQGWPEQPRAASGELPTASQAPSQGGIPPYTPAASGGALSALAGEIVEWFGGSSKANSIEWVAQRLAAHDQKVREQMLEEAAQVIDREIADREKFDEHMVPIDELAAAIRALASRAEEHR